MESVVNVYFRVIRYTQEGASRFSRILILESVNLEQTFPDLCAGLNAVRYSNFIDEIKQAFPELQENKSLGTNKFKLVFPGKNFSLTLLLKINCNFQFYFII